MHEHEFKVAFRQFKNGEVIYTFLTCPCGETKVEEGGTLPEQKSQYGSQYGI